MSILIVEDNPISLRTVEMILQSSGLETVSAKSGRQALERLDAHEDIQLVLSDLMMSDMDGYELLESINRHPVWKDIPVVVMTSLSDGETVRRVVSLGCRSYLVKPVREDSLLPKVRQLMKDPAGVAEGPLKAKFKVMEETGLDPARYEEIFDKFRSELQDAVSLFAGDDPTGAEHPIVRCAVALREGASVLCCGALPLLLESLRSRGSCEWAALRTACDATLKAMQLAVEKRDRLREKLARSEPSTFDA
jgi:CheY-like chemotaxis protein